jgi:hypothetical protein
MATGWNMQVTVIQYNYINKIEVHLFIFNTFYAPN